MRAAIIVFGFILLVSSIFLLFRALHQTTEGPVKELSKDEYSAISKRLSQIVREQNPRIGLTELQKEMLVSPSVAVSCHPLAHDLGRTSYNKYQNFAQALEYNVEICNSGYLHGVIETHFQNSKDVFKDMHTLCNDYAKGKFLAWQCYHGIGHGFMFYTDNNLHQSLKACERYSDEFSRSSCTNGVFMENFNTEQKVHFSSFIDQKNPASLCKKVSSEEKNSCNYYAPIYKLYSNNNDYKSTFDWCKSLGSDSHFFCVAGTGAQIIKKHINTPREAEKICRESGKFRNACISGMTEYFLNYTGSLNEGKKLCDKLTPEGMEICKQTLNTQRALFTN